MQENSIRMIQQQQRAMVLVRPTIDRIWLDTKLKTTRKTTMDWSIQKGEWAMLRKNRSRKKWKITYTLSENFVTASNTKSNFKTCSF
jgi:hypothetical protein